MAYYATFYSGYSPVKAGSAHTGDNNIVADWQRLRDVRVLINNRPLTDCEGYDSIKSPESLRHFFKKHLLCNMSNDIERVRASNDLMDTLHQGGYLHPASTPLSEVINTASESNLGLSSSPADKSIKINIIPTDDGFKIQEIVTLTQMNLTINAGEELYRQYPEGKISPDQGKKFVLRSQVTLDVHLGHKPKVQVSSNTIDFGNEQVRTMIDQRSFLSKVVDALTRLLGRNKFEVLCVKPETTETNRPR